MPEPKQREVLEEAVHLAAKVIARALRHRAEQIKDGSMGSGQTETPNQIAEEALSDAYPAIRRQAQEEERERLTGENFIHRVASLLMRPSTVKAAYHHLEGVKLGQRLEAALREAVLAALDSEVGDTK
jgi:hypothetical protein